MKDAELLLEWLKIGPVSHEAAEKIGIDDVVAAVEELGRLGYFIHREKRPLWDQYGLIRYTTVFSITKDWTQRDWVAA